MNSKPTSVLVHLDAGPHSAARLRAARALAQRRQAQVQAMYAVTPSLYEVPFALEIGSAASAALQDFDDQRRRAARAHFDALAAQPGPELAWSEAGPDAAALPAFIQQACYADLLVLGQRDPQHDVSGLPFDFVESVVIGSGRPAVVLPYTEPPEPIGERVLVAWKETPQSVHAVTAALPMLGAAPQVHVACWGCDPAGIRRYLGRHGIDAQIHAQEDAPAEVGELLLSLAADLSADLLVMGCYGHSRARELVLGGATRTILRSMTLPVLLAH